MISGLINTVNNCNLNVQPMLLNSSYSGTIARVAEFDQIAIVLQYAIWY